MTRRRCRQPGAPTNGSNSHGARRPTDSSSTPGGLSHPLRRFEEGWLRPTSLRCWRGGGATRLTRCPQKALSVRTCGFESRPPHNDGQQPEHRGVTATGRGVPRPLHRAEVVATVGRDEVAGRGRRSGGLDRRRPRAADPVARGPVRSGPDAVTGPVKPSSPSAGLTTVAAPGRPA